MSLLWPYTSAMLRRRRRAAFAVSSSASTTICPPMMCSPPAKRSIVETSALRQQGLVTSRRESSSFTFAVMAMGDILPPRSSTLVRQVRTRCNGGRPHEMTSRSAAASRSGSWTPGSRRAATGAMTSSAPSSAAAARSDASSGTTLGSASTTSRRRSGALAAKEARWSSARKSRVSPMCTSRLRLSRRLAGVVTRASARAGTSRCGMTEVNHEPGPNITQSASRTAVRASWHGSGQVGTMPIEDTMPGDDATRCCPRTSTVSSGRSGSWPRISATMSSGSAAIGSTRPRAPSRRPTRSSPWTVSPSSSQMETIMRLPSAWPWRSPVPAKRCCSTSRQVWPQSLSSQSAASAMRRSPGGRTSNSSRRRPLEPPSSATVTTAVTSSVSSRRADRAAASPCPPPSATMRRWCGEPRGGREEATEKVLVTRSLAAQVPVDDEGVDAVASPEPSAQRLGDRHGPVLATRAADGDRDVAAALADVAVDHRVEQAAGPAQELVGALLPHDELADRRVPSGQGPQLGDPVRVGQEAHVEDDVGIERQAVLEPERHDGDAQLDAAVAREERGQLGAQLVHVEARAVDDDVGGRAQVEEQLALALDAVEEPAVTLQRVRAADALETPHEGLVGRVEEHEAGSLAPGAGRPDGVRELGEPPPGADVDDDGDLLQVCLGVARPGLVAQLGEMAEQLGRQVVDDEPAQVLEDVGGRAAAGAAHAGDDDDGGIGQGCLGGWAAVGGHSSTSPVVRFTAGSWGAPSAKWLTTADASDRPKPGTAMMSVMSAARRRLTEPNWRSSAFWRLAPSPGMPSSWEVVMALDRRWRWKVMANRWASSRSRWSRYRPSLVRGRMTGWSSRGSHTSSRRLASPTRATSSIPSSSSTACAALTWGSPPSTTTRLGG